MRRDHPALAGRGEGEGIAAGDLAAYPRAVMLFPDHRQMLADDVLARLCPQPLPTLPVFSTPYFLSGPLAVEGSDLVLCVPTRAARRMSRMNALAAVDLPQAEPFTYRLIWHERSHRAPSHIWLRDAIRTSLAAEP